MLDRRTLVLLTGSAFPIGALALGVLAASTARAGQGMADLAMALFGMIMGGPLASLLVFALLLKRTDVKPNRRAKVLVRLGWGLFLATGAVLLCVVVMVRMEWPFMLFLVLPAGALVATYGARAAVNVG